RAGAPLDGAWRPCMINLLRALPTRRPPQREATTATGVGVALLVWLVLAVSQARAEEERRTAIVKAVDRGRDGIVMLKVIKSGEYGQREVGGTGVVIDERGFLLTNAHIVTGASRVYATLADKTRIEATVHTSVPKHDLAILRLPVKGKIKAL